MKHSVIVFSQYDVDIDVRVEAWCKPCDVELYRGEPVTLDELTRLADEHITTADRGQ